MCHTWVKHRGVLEVLEIEKVKPKKTWRNLTRFFMDLRKQVGQNYKTNSVCSM